MKVEMLFHVWQAIQLTKTEFGIFENRRFKELEFIKAHDYDVMNFSSAAFLFSGTMKNMLDDVIKSHGKYLIANVPPSVDSKKFYSKSYGIIS